MDPWLVHEIVINYLKMSQSRGTQYVHGIFQHMQNVPCALEHNRTIYIYIQGVHSKLSLICLDNKQYLERKKKKKEKKSLYSQGSVERLEGR